MKTGYKRPPARPRADVTAACPNPKPLGRSDIDCTSDHERNRNLSSAMYGITSARYDALAVRTEAQNLAMKAREERRIEASFNYEGLGVRASGRNKRFDPDAGASRLERDLVDAAIRGGGVNRPLPTQRHESDYTGEGTKLTFARWTEPIS
jgi:hypothetical protein